LNEINLADRPRNFINTKNFREVPTIIVLPERPDLDDTGNLRLAKLHSHASWRRLRWRKLASYHQSHLCPATIAVATASVMVCAILIRPAHAPVQCLLKTCNFYYRRSLRRFRGRGCNRPEEVWRFF
jgi:hypothetical protein